MQKTAKSSSKVWDYATRLEVNGVPSGKCKRCGKVIKCTGRSTTTLAKHLRTHNIDLGAGVEELEVSSSSACSTSTSAKPSKVTHHAQDLMKRLFAVETEVPIQQEEEVEMLMSLQDELDSLITASHKEPEAHNDEFKILKTEFSVLKGTGKKSQNLQSLHDALLTIKPTSTDVERVRLLIIFLKSSFFCTKIRSRLSDSSLNALIFLKFYYRTLNSLQKPLCNR